MHLMRWLMKLHVSLAGVSESLKYQGCEKIGCEGVCVHSADSSMYQQKISVWYRMCTSSMKKKYKM